MKVLGYVRVSTDQQGDDGVSLDAQRARIAAYAEAMGVELVDVVQEVASARTLKRDGWQIVCARIEAGEAQGVLVAKLDRLTRSVRDLGELLETTFSERNGVALLSVADSIDTRSANGRLVLNLLTMVAQWERETISERTREALQHLRKQGVRTGSAFYGARLLDQLDAAGRRIWTIDEAEYAVVRMVVAATDRFKRSTRARRGTGDLNLSAIARWLNEQGHRTREGCEWTAKQVSRVLRHADELDVLARQGQQQSQSQEAVNA